MRQEPCSLTKLKNAAARTSQKGFSLLEIIIAVAILASLALFSAQAIRQAVQIKGKIQSQVDQASALRETLRIIERDIQLAFHHRDFELELFDQLRKSSSRGGNYVPNDPNNVNNPFVPKGDAPRKDPTTHFLGAENTVNFVTMNAPRLLRNTKQADFVEVGYSLKSCKLNSANSTGQCLWRRTSAIVDSDLTAGGDETPLLPNITEFKLRYIGKGKQDWVTSWRTDGGGDAATKDRFPAAVEVSLTIEPENKKKYSMQIIAPIHFPNNKEGQTP